MLFVAPLVLVTKNVVKIPSCEKLPSLGHKLASQEALKEVLDRVEKRYLFKDSPVHPDQREMAIRNAREVIGFFGKS